MKRSRMALFIIWIFCNAMLLENKLGKRIRSIFSFWRSNGVFYFVTSHSPLYSMFVKRILTLQPSKKWVNEVKIKSFQPQNLFFKNPRLLEISLCIVNYKAHCFHKVYQTHLSVNRSVDCLCQKRIYFVFLNGCTSFQIKLLAVSFGRFCV